MTALREILSSIKADSPDVEPVSLACGPKSGGVPVRPGSDSAVVRALIEAMALCPEHHRREPSKDDPSVSGAIF
ncbi:MAG: hypothetical protein IT210_09185 [Armatimonadetes bacterium]|nr:hypothetical protein [Armatimonadota bacterium]